MAEPVNTSNPLAGPYRTGTYLVSDAGPDNWRSAMTLPDHPYRASGSHQVGISDWVRLFQQLPAGVSRLWLVDLRQETHGYLDGAPYSWYADNDWANVGAGRDWIVADEIARLAGLEGRIAKVFTIEPDPNDDLKQERVLPTSVTEIRIESARTEADVAQILTEVFRPMSVEYKRIPVTDHCAPSDRALTQLTNLASEVGPNDWVHFHCHGGDGRTTTFLCAYDMLCWKRGYDSPLARATNAPSDPLPSLETFVTRQLSLFDYCLDPSGELCNIAPETGWKLSLDELRWQALSEFLAELGKPNVQFGSAR